MKENLKDKAEKYDDLDWSFSSAFLYSKVVQSNSTTQTLLRYSDQLRLSGNFIEAENILRNINKNEISNDQIFHYHIRLGCLYKDQGKIDEAIFEFKQSISIGTNETYPYIYLASLYSKKSNLEEVENLLIEALKKDGDIDEVYYNLSTNYARKGNLDKAIEKMELCLKLDPNFSNAKTMLEDFKNTKEIINKY